MLRVSTLLCLTAFLDFVDRLWRFLRFRLDMFHGMLLVPVPAVNLTYSTVPGQNCFAGDTTFPVSTPVNLSSLSLTIDFSNGSSQ